MSVPDDRLDGAATVSLRTPTAVIEAAVRNRICELAVAGELDLASSGLLDQALSNWRWREIDGVVLDLSAVTFIDSAGLGAVLTARALCVDRGCEFRVDGASRHVRHILELTGTLTELSLPDLLNGDRE